MRFGIFGLLMAMPLYAAVNDFDREQIQQRISPVGNVHLQGAAQSAGVALQQPEKPVEVKKEPGQVTYEQYCVVCHRDAVAGAPKFRDAANWGPRTAQKNLDALTASAIKGLNAMPPKGTCQECTEADLKAAIKYMAPQS